jgi:hypothetical protein
VGGTSGLHDGPLIGRTEGFTEAGQGSLDKPRFEGHPCGLAVGIKFPGHSQVLGCKRDAPGVQNYADEDDRVPVFGASFSGDFDRG